jgi:hypothetical protein
MEWGKKNLWSGAAAFLIASTNLLNAADDPQLLNLEHRVSSLEQRKASKGISNPSERPIVKNGFNLFFQGDVLIWQASEPGLGYAVKNKNGSTYINEGKVVKPYFNWDWGFKLAAGSNMLHDGWDVLVQWTRFYSLNSEHGVSAQPGGVLYPTYANAALATDGSTPGPLQSGFQGASAYWKLRLNLLDLDLGREFYVSKWLTLRPHAGFRNAWLRQRFNVNYNNGTISPSLTGQHLSARMRNNFWGMGVRGGLDAHWLLGGSMSVFSDLAAAILFGHFKIEQTETRSSVSPGQPRLNVEEWFRAARASLDLAAGLCYEDLFCHDRYGLMFRLAWEQHLFFNQNQLMKFPTASGAVTGQHYPGLLVSNDGDLSTQGVTFSVRFDF